MGEKHKTREEIIDEISELKKQLKRSEERIKTIKSVENINIPDNGSSQREKFEDDLHRLNERLNIASRAARAGIWDWDIINGAIEWSPLMFKLFGLDPEKTTPSFQAWNSILHPEDLDISNERIELAVQNHTFLDSQYRIIRPDGQIRWINARGQTEYDSIGRPLWMTGICIDITERKTAEEKIYRREKLLNAINKVFNEALTCETVNEVFGKCLEVAKDLTGSEFGFIGEINANGRFDTKILSFPAWEQCTTKNALELVQDMAIVSYWGRTLKEEKSQLVNEPHSDPESRGLPEGHPPITSFLGVPLKQGEKTFGMIALANKKTKYTEADQENIEALSVAFVEALMRKRAENRLKKSEEKYHSLYSSMSEGVAIHEMIYGSGNDAIDYLVTDVNPAYEEILGLKSSDVIGKKASEIYRTGKPPYIEIYARVAESGQSTYFETYFEPMNKSFRIAVVSPEKGKFATFFEEISERKEAERVIKENQMKLRSLFDLMPIGISIMDAERNVIDTNPALEKILKLNKKELKEGKYLKRKYLRSDLTEMPYQDLPSIIAANEEKLVQDAEVGVITEDNSLIWTNVNAIPLPFPDWKIMVTTSDITKRKVAEKDLKDSEERYRNLVELSPNCIMVHRKGQILYMNPAGVKLFGASSLEDAVGRSIYETLAPDEIDLVKARVKQVEEKGLPTLPHEFKCKTFEDKSFVGEARATPIIFNGKPSVQVILTDITERKKMEKEKEMLLAESKQIQKELSTLIENIVDEVWFCDEQGHIILANAAARKFAQKANQKDGTLEGLMHNIEVYTSKGTLRTLNGSPLLLSLNGKILTATEEIVVFPSGERQYRQVSSAPIKDEDGKIIAAVAVARNVTRQKQVEQDLKDTLKKLEKSNADLKEFAYVASHDLREPLRMITSFLQLLERRYQDQLDDDANEFIGFAVDGAKRLDNMIQDLLIYSRVTRGKKSFKKLDFEKVLADTLLNLKPSIEENSAVITYDPLPSLYADEGLMIQLFQNLLSNALKYHGPEPPQIHISAQKKGSCYLFSVKDNGIGIDPEHLNRIFNIFQRLHTQDMYEGTGIGLAIAQKIVYRHGGKIWAESQPGKGSTFYFEIPIKKPQV